MNRFLTLLKSKTVWGGLAAAGSWLATQPKIGVVEVVQAGGVVLSAVGVRDAIAKQGTPPAGPQG